MKKLYFIAVAALMASMVACSGEKKANEAAAADTTVQAVEEVVVVEEDAAGNVMVAAEALVKKIDNKEALNDADFGVALDYMIAFLEDMQKNPSDIEGLKAKYANVGKISDAFESVDLEKLSPENKAKYEKFQELK